MESRADIFSTAAEAFDLDTLSGCVDSFVIIPHRQQFAFQVTWTKLITYYLGGNFRSSSRSFSFIIRRAANISARWNIYGNMT